MYVSVNNEQVALKIDPSSVARIAQEVVALEKRSYDEVTVHFVDTKAICDLHAQYFDDPSPTDCISFPVDEVQFTGYRLMGDVFICTETAIQYAKKHHCDPYQETTLYLVHGLLHLMGYDDMEQRVRNVMRRAEKRHMNHLQKLGLSISGK